MDQTTRDFFSTQHQRNNNDKFYSTNVFTNAKQIQPLTGVQWKHPQSFNQVAQVTQPQAILPRLGSGIKPIFQNCFSTMTNLVMNRFQDEHSNSPEQTYIESNADQTYSENPCTFPMSYGTEDCSMMFQDQRQQLMFTSEHDQYNIGDYSFGQIEMSENHFGTSYNSSIVYQEDSLSCSTSPENLAMFPSPSFDDAYTESQTLDNSPTNDLMRCLNSLIIFTSKIFFIKQN